MAHPLLARVRVALARSPNFNATAFKRRSTRERPHNAYGKHHRAKVSAAFVIEAAALSFAGAGNLPGLLRALRISDTAWLQFKLPESRSPPFRVLTCSF